MHLRSSRGAARGAVGGAARLSRPIRGVAVLLLCTTLAAGCYRQVPLEGTPTAGTRVVALLTPEGSTRMASAIGEEVARVEGEILSAGAGQWQLRMIGVTHRDGRETLWNRETVAFPSEYLARVDSRELDRTRTVLTAGGVIAVALFLGRTFVRSVFGGDENGKGPIQPPE